MNIILLSGGSGKRLWPLSNDVRSKQFIRLFPNEKGEKESMVQRMFRQINKIDSNANITVASSKSQISELKNQLGDNIRISVEPFSKDTFPAIALAVSYLHDAEHIGVEEPIVVCPVDPYVDDGYFQALKSLSELAGKNNSNLVLMGIEPTYPSEKYGYIIPETSKQVSKVLMFKEKPTEEVAKSYIAKGALWNGGVFAFKLGYLLKKSHQLLDFKDYKDLFSKYQTLNKISFDYAVVEKESEIEVMRFSGLWKDLGTWNTLTESMGTDNVGNVVIGEGCEKCHIVNELDIPFLVVGVKNIITAASSEGVLITNKEGSSKIKPYVERLNTPVRYAEKSWGEYKVTDFGKGYLTIKIALIKGHKMSYHSHYRRKEVWTITSGIGTVILNGIKRKVSTGDVISIDFGVKHTIFAETNLELIEVQLGENIDEKDKVKFEFKE
jgi:mannose-1-phosphate guanylyltransferase